MTGIPEEENHGGKEKVMDGDVEHAEMVGKLSTGKVSGKKDQNKGWQNTGKQWSQGGNW